MLRKVLSTLRSFRAFIIVGLIATLIHYVVLKLLMGGDSAMPLILANILGYCSALIVSYTGNRYFVFEAKRGHLNGFAVLVVGYLIVLAIHTGIIVGLTDGAIMETMNSWLAPFGGQLLLNMWFGIVNFLPPSWSANLTGETGLSMSTTAAFFFASGAAAVLTYGWNRFVVFQPKQLVKQLAPASSTSETASEA